MLVEQGIITDKQLTRAIEEQKKNDKRLGEILVDLGFISEGEFYAFLGKRLKIPTIDLTNFQHHEEVVRLIPEEVARRFNVIALAEGEKVILVGMADPTDIFVLDDLSRRLPKPIRPALVKTSDLHKNFDRLYRTSGEIQDFAEELGQEVSPSSHDLAQIVETEMLVDAPVVKFLQSIFEDAIRAGASDIHIQPGANVLRIRQRIDGVLHERTIKETHIAPALVSKIKLMANLEISERRLPQDGRFSLKVNNKSIDVRVSTLAIQNGESVVMRLLNQSSGVKTLDELGLPDDIYKGFTNLLRRMHGMILVVGPTGSGKSTTLYTALNMLNVPGKNIITVEDPVEYQLERINQVQIRPKIGLDFATVLRAILRQDPDIVMVGEMRDRETADIAIRAALTGHLILSTLHTNDAVSTTTRLLEMGLPGYAVASSLLGIFSQRLVRRVCDNCSQQDEPDEIHLRWLAGMRENYDVKNLRRGKGCPRCLQTGYSGRVAVMELLVMNDEFAQALRREDIAALPTLTKTHPTFRSLPNVALDYAFKGVTTLAEVVALANNI
ncbi:MAG TPA: type II/IV secretion system protein [Magnetococcales bacterium]|nr:type II/IV secretion system protein [Magnetococcales bacterium]